MNRIALGLAAACLVAFSAFAAEYKDPAFTLNLPASFGPPTKASAKAQNIETDTWVAKAPTGEAIVVSVSKMPAKITDPAKVMDSTRDSLLKSVNGTLESEQTIAGDMPSRLFVFRSGSAFLRSRLYVDNDKLYQLLYVGRTEEQRADPAVAQMFDTFKITNLPMTSDSTTPPAPGTVKATTTVTKTTTTTTPPSTTTITTTTNPNPPQR